MRRIVHSIAMLAAAAAALISCNKEVNPIEPTEKEYTYTFALSNTDTKAYLDLDDAITKWDEGDQLGVYAVTPSGTSYNRWGNITLLNPVVFQISSYYALTAGSSVYCYFPYDSNNSKGDAQDPTKVNLSIPAEQNGKMNAMPMVSVPYSMTKAVNAQTDEPIADINMRNLGGVFQFRVFSSKAAYQTETVKSVKFSSDSDIAGSFVFDITQDTNLEISGNVGKSITVTQDAKVGSDKLNGGLVNMVVKPGSYAGALVVTTNAATYTFDISTKKAVERSHIKPLNVDLSKGNREAYATMSSFSAVSGVVGGDSNISYLAEKGNAGTAPAVNSNQIRIYQNGGLFTVSANNGVTITSVVLGSAMATSVTYSIDGGTASKASSIGANGKLAINNVAISESIKFTCVGTTSSSRLYVNYLYVTYVGGNGETVVVKLISPVDQNGLNPAAGTYDIEGMYVLTNINEDSDPIEVTSSTNISNITAYGGEIEFDMEPNYTSSTANGTITLTLKSDPSVTTTIKVQQSSSRFVVSSNEVVIPANSDEVTFTVTSKYFNWTISSDNEEHLAYDNAGIANDSPVTVTVSSDVAASSETQTIGTLTLIRNSNSSDPQKQLVVIKKEKKVGAGDPIYRKVDQVTSGGKYLLVSQYGEAPFICSGLLSNKSFTLIDAMSLITDEGVYASDVINGYAVTIDETSKDLYTITNSQGYTLTVSKGDVQSGTNNTEWTLSNHTDGSFIISNTSTNTRALFIGNSGASCKNYAISNFNSTSYANTYMYLYEYTK